MAIQTGEGPGGIKYLDVERIAFSLPFVMQYIVNLKSTPRYML
jgi:hypothetical protein